MERYKNCDIMPKCVFVTARSSTKGQLVLESKRDAARSKRPRAFPKPLIPNIKPLETSRKAVSSLFDYLLKLKSYKTIFRNEFSQKDADTLCLMRLPS